MPQLRILDVSLTKITKRGVPHLMRLQNLRRLEISPAVLDLDLVEVLGAHPNLGEIGLRGPGGGVELLGSIADTIGAAQGLGAW
jgi:hypothetical protein